MFCNGACCFCSIPCCKEIEKNKFSDEEHIGTYEIKKNLFSKEKVRKVKNESRAIGIEYTSQ